MIHILLKDIITYGKHYYSAVTVNFGQSLYSYSENYGVVSDIAIILSTTIAQSLTVTVSGGNDKYIIII